ncbi:hypothetical protein D3C74_440020 [compost metagenome]
MIRRAYLLLRAPGRIEVILRSRSVQGRRPRLAVDKDHVVAFAVPVPLPGLPQVVDVQIAADVMAFALSLQEDVVAVPGRVFAAEFK